MTEAEQQISGLGAVVNKREPEGFGLKGCRTWIPRARGRMIERWLLERAIGYSRLGAGSPLKAPCGTDGK